MFSFFTQQLPPSIRRPFCDILRNKKVFLDHLGILENCPFKSNFTINISFGESKGVRQKRLSVLECLSYSSNFIKKLV